MHFGYTIVYVPDVKAAIDFYAAAFGCTLRFNAEDWDYAELETGDTTLAFAAERMADVVGITIVPNRANATAAGVELAFVTEQVAEAYAKAIATGATPVSEPHQTLGDKLSPTSATSTASSSRAAPPSLDSE
jgi:lactoylglutathione lyase